MLICKKWHRQLEAVLLLLKRRKTTAEFYVTRGNPNALTSYSTL